MTAMAAGRGATTIRPLLVWTVIVTACVVTLSLSLWSGFFLSQIVLYSAVPIVLIMIALVLVRSVRARYWVGVAASLICLASTVVVVSYPYYSMIVNG